MTKSAYARWIKEDENILSTEKEWICGLIIEWNRVMATKVICTARSLKRRRQDGKIGSVVGCIIVWKGVKTDKKGFERRNARRQHCRR